MEEERKEFGLKEMLQIFKEKKKTYLIVAAVSFLIGTIIAFSIPKSYTTKVMLAPESNSEGGALGSLAGLASSFGVNMNLANSVDAISTEFYPNVINSTNFIVNLFNIPIETEDGKIKTTLVDYIQNHQKAPWWAAVMKLLQFGKKEDAGGGTKIDPYRLTKAQTEIVKALQGMITCNVDKETSIITIKFTAQDPLVSAQLVDSISNHLQQFITDYRTTKARNDLAYNEELFAEAKAQYVKAQRDYAQFSDANSELVLQSYKQREEALENEMQLRYNIYSQVSQQLQLAKAKVQEKTPVYAVIEPATVPVRKSAPRRMFIVLLFVFVGVFGYTAWNMLRETLR